MKKICFAIAVIFTLSASLVSCRNYDAQDGNYSYYNDSVKDRNYYNNERVRDNETKNRMDRAVDKARRGIKNTFDDTAENLGNAIGVN